MYEAFEKQPQAKKDLILQIAMEEFSRNGYEKTSTDIITSRAGISKGLLFHYFKSKKNLYLYLVAHSVSLLTEKTIATLSELQSDDFFERIQEAAHLKQKITAQYKQETQFAADALFQPPKAVMLEIEELMKKHNETYNQEFIQSCLYPKELIAEERLRPGISKEKVVQMTAFVVEQLSAKYQALQKSGHDGFLEEPDALMQELDDYLDIVKHGVYRLEC